MVIIIIISIISIIIIIIKISFFFSPFITPNSGGVGTHLTRLVLHYLS